MCVIAVCKERRITEKDFEKMWIANPDGFGMAWRDKEGKVHYKKGFMKLEDAKEFYFSKEYPLPHVLHFRIASIGEVVPQLTHPFMVGWENNLEGSTTNGVLFQNGTSQKAVQYLIQLLLNRGIKLSDIHWNDARALAVLVHELGIGFLDLMENAGKIVVFTPTKIILKNTFFEKNGCLFSNLYWSFSSQNRGWSRYLTENYYDNYYDKCQKDDAKCDNDISWNDNDINF